MLEDWVWLLGSAGRGRRVCSVFFQAEDGIRDAQESRGLGDVYKRQHLRRQVVETLGKQVGVDRRQLVAGIAQVDRGVELSLIHI